MRARLRDCWDQEWSALKVDGDEVFKRVEEILLILLEMYSDTLYRMHESASFPWVYSWICA